MSDKDRRTVLCAASHPGSANAIMPVIRRLHDEDMVDMVVIGEEASQKIFAVHDIEYQTLHSYGPSVPCRENMHSLLATVGPDLVVTGTASQDPARQYATLEQELTGAARERIIPTIAVLDFWSDYRARFSDIVVGYEFCFLPDLVCIMDEWAKMDMRDEGFSEERLVVTGNPYFDEVQEVATSVFNEEGDAGIRSVLCPRCEFLLVFIGNVFKDEAEVLGFWDLDNVKLIDEVISRLPKEAWQTVGWAISIHPRMQEDDLDGFLELVAFQKEAKTRPALLMHTNTLRLMAAADLVVTGTSTAAVEAVLMGKPCISLQPGQKTEDQLIVSRKGVIPVGRTRDGCQQLLHRALGDDRAAYLKGITERTSRLFPHRPGATERVVNVVYEMMGMDPPE